MLAAPGLAHSLGHAGLPWPLLPLVVPGCPEAGTFKLSPSLTLALSSLKYVVFMLQEDVALEMKVPSEEFLLWVAASLGLEGSLEAWRRWLRLPSLPLVHSLATCQVLSAPWGPGMALVQLSLEGAGVLRRGSELGSRNQPGRRTPAPVILWLQFSQSLSLWGGRGGKRSAGDRW